MKRLLRSPRILALASLVLLAGPSAYALPRASTTFGLEFPHILAGQIDLIYSPKWTLGFNLGGFAYTLNTSSGAVPLSMAAGNVHVRWAPFNGIFFLGLAGGLQKVGASGSRTFTVTDSNTSQSVSIPASASLNVLSPFLTPHLGWFVPTRWGFTFGLEAGVQIPIHTTSSIDVEITDPAQNQYLSLLQQTDLYKSTAAQIEDQIAKYANIVLPYAAIRLGWTF